MVDELLSNGYGCVLQRTAYDAAGTHDDYGELHYFLRQELLKRVGVENEEPAEKARSDWESFRFPETFKKIWMKRWTS